MVSLYCKEINAPKTSDPVVGHTGLTIKLNSPPPRHKTHWYFGLELEALLRVDTQIVHYTDLEWFIVNRVHF